MKYLKRSLIISNILLLFYIQDIFADNKSYDNNAFINPDIQMVLNDINNQNTDNTEYEHPFRRFEITFFITVPFTFLISFLSLSIFDTIHDSIEKKEFDSNVNVWKEYKIPLIAGTIGLSTAIASREAWICVKTNRERRQKSGNKSDQNINISITKYF